MVVTKQNKRLMLLVLKDRFPISGFPVPSPQSGMMGVPWTGYFALDTKTGQLCLTSDKYVPEKFNELPTCVVLTMTNPDPK
jgi:hypothetical protein